VVCGKEVAVGLCVQGAEARLEGRIRAFEQEGVGRYPLGYADGEADTPEVGGGAGAFGDCLAAHEDRVYGDGLEGVVEHSERPGPLFCLGQEQREPEDVCRVGGDAAVEPDGGVGEVAALVDVADRHAGFLLEAVVEPRRPFELRRADGDGRG